MHSVKSYSPEGSTGQWLAAYSSPYSLFLANAFGTLGTWFTVLMTLESLVLITLPFKATKLCGPPQAYLAACSISVLAAGLQVVYLITRQVQEIPCDPHKRYTVETAEGEIYYQYEIVYYWLNAIFVIVIPFIMMLMIAVVLTLPIQNRNQFMNSFSSRKRSVLLITYATLLCHLIFESPNLVISLIAAFGDAGDQAHPMCVANLVGNLLSMANATIPFFVYFCCSQQFREMLVCRFRQCFGFNVDYALVNGERRSSCAPAARMLTGTLA